MCHICGQLLELLVLIKGRQVLTIGAIEHQVSNIPVLIHPTLKKLKHICRIVIALYIELVHPVLHIFSISMIHEEGDICR
ncbi:hypothetical protein D3C81_958740 [compost metagenome]